MSARCRKCDEYEAGIVYHGWTHDRSNWNSPVATDETREQMMRAHFPFGCGPGGKELLRERGYVYPREYLQEQRVLLFQGDAEWLAYMTGGAK